MGPTTAAQNTDDPPPTLGGPHTGTLGLSNTTIETSTAGSVFVIAEVSLGVNCPNATYNCDFAVGAYIDGRPVGGAVEFDLIPVGTFKSLQSHFFGIATNVPAGKHEITLGWDGESPNPSTLVVESGGHVGAIALGG